MQTIELFCGTKSFSKIAEHLGHSTLTIDNNELHNPDIKMDILNINVNGLKKFDVVWMSPPCTTFSLASCNTHWTKDRKPKTDQAIIGLKLLKKCEEIAEFCIKNNKIFFIENPNGRAVWFLPDQWLKRVWYCQYGDKRAKPTNIWTNLNIEFKTCKNYTKNQILGLEPKHCHHESAPRGSKTGTQGCKGAKERGVIPPKLFEHIFKTIEEQKDKNDK